MSVRLIVEKIETEYWGCDICGHVAPDLATTSTSTSVTRTVSPITGDSHDHWTETDWSLCPTCTAALEGRNRLSLIWRAENGHKDDPVRMARAIANIETLLGELPAA